MLDRFFDFVFTWTAIWLTVTAIAMVVSLHRSPIRWKFFWDYHVIGFIGSIAFVCVSVAIRRWYDWDTNALVPAYSIFAWTSFTNALRVTYLVWKGRQPRDNTDDIISHDPESPTFDVEGRVPGSTEPTLPGGH